MLHGPTLQKVAPMSDDAPVVPRLTYFGFRGLGEPIRLLFEDVGLPYVERRVGGDDWEALKPTLPFRQMPVLEAGGRAIVQSHAILRHLARAHGLYGPDEDARVRADATADAVRDAQNAMWDHFWLPDSDAAEPARAFEAGRLRQDLALLDAWLGAAPFFAGAAPTFADYYALTYLDEAAAYFPAAFEAAPGLDGFRTRLAARPRLAAYAASGRQPAAYGFDPIRGLRFGPPRSA
jgi:glutathione S-transferase